MFAIIKLLVYNNKQIEGYMKLYIETFKLFFKKTILRKNSGIIIRDFVKKMGIVYIKLAQILATQNLGRAFTEEDRRILSSICDDCNPISYDEIEEILKEEYGNRLNDIFNFIEKKPIGSASVSQVHRAILKNGDEVAIKIKRKDIAKTIDTDIKKIRKIMHRFGKMSSFKNIIGGDHALDLYLSWIKQETDFVHERENIKIYQKFASDVNGKVHDTKLIKVPKLYEEYCTKNIIVMEFIKNKTINKMELTNENKSNITNAVNSYIKSSFWAAFNNKQVVFHGDPHSGNICIDDNGDICFLDMGLLCVLSDEDVRLCRDFFLSAYLGNYEKLYNMLVIYGNMSDKKKKLFKEDCKKYCDKVNKRDVSYYFMDMAKICVKYEFVPPDFLFNMAKAFACLNGINKFTNNNHSCVELLQEQIIEFMIKRNLEDCKKLVINNIKLFPKALDGIFRYGFVESLSQTLSNKELVKDINCILENLKEIRDLARSTYCDDKTNNQEQPKILSKTL